MDLSDELIGLGGDDREGLEIASVRPLPRVPDAGEANGPGSVRVMAKTRLTGLAGFDFFRGAGVPKRSIDPSGTSSAADSGV